MQEQGKPRKKRKQPKTKTTAKGTMLSNPYQNTPVKSNYNMKAQNRVPSSGFGFGGSIFG